MARYVTFFIALGVIIAVALFGMRQPLPRRDVTIGVLLCLTGTCATYGTNALKGVQLATEEINAAGGIAGRKLALVIQNTEEADGPSKAIAGFKHLTAKTNIDFLIGPSWTPAALALAPLVGAQPELVAISPSVGVAEYNETAANIFNLWPHDAMATKKLAEIAWERGFRRIAIFSSEQPWEHLQAVTFKQHFTELGGTIVDFEETLPEAADIRMETTRIVQSKPEAVLLANYTNLGLAARTVRKLGFTGQLFSIVMDNDRIVDAQGALEGTVFVSPRLPSAEFVAKFAKRFGEPPGIAADTAYDAVYLMTKVASAEPRLRESLLLASKLEGASGSVSFDAQGGVLREVGLFTVRDGKEALEKRI